MSRSTEWRGWIAVACLSLMTVSVGAQPDVTVQQIAPRVFVISQRDANLVLMTGEDASFVSGVSYAPLVARAQAVIEEQKARPVRYALIMEDEASLAEGDSGWGARQAVALIHEKLYSRMYSASHGRKGKPPALVLKNPTPVLGFSEVVQVQLANEEIHIIHARSG